MDYQNKIKEIIYNNSEYFPFEWIRSFKMRNKSLPLADEEEKHYKLLDNIIELITKPEIWLENAEFNHLDEF